MEKVYSFICDFAHISNITGKIDAKGIFSEMSSTSFPTAPKSFTYVCQLSSSMDTHGKHDLAIILMDYDGKEIVKLKLTIPISQPGLIQPMCLTFSNVSFPHPGIYQIDVNSNEENICSNQIEVKSIVNNSVSSL